MERAEEREGKGGERKKEEREEQEGRGKGGSGCLRIGDYYSRVHCSTRKNIMGQDKAVRYSRGVIPIDPEVARVFKTASAYFSVAATRSPPPCRQ
jgi:ribosomal protein S26